LWAKVPEVFYHKNEICRVKYSAALYSELFSSRHEAIVILKAAFHYREQLYPSQTLMAFEHRVAHPLVS
jgi:hypothetical protein